MARLGRSQPIKPHINIPGRIGIYFNRKLVGGYVTLSGSGVSGAIVRLIRQDTDTEIAKTTTDANGWYQFVSPDVVQQGINYHVTVEYTDGSSNKYNASSLWNVNPAVTPT